MPFFAIGYSCSCCCTTMKALGIVLLLSSGLVEAFVPHSPVHVVPWNGIRLPRIETTTLFEQASDRAASSRVDAVLSTLTSAFPLWVLSSALIGASRPSLLSWVNRGNLISVMLASVMCGTGLTLEAKDFAEVLKENWLSVPRMCRRNLAGEHCRSSHPLSQSVRCVSFSLCRAAPGSSAGL